MQQMFIYLDEKKKKKMKKSISSMLKSERISCVFVYESESMSDSIQSAKRNECMCLYVKRYVCWLEVV